MQHIVRSTLIFTVITFLNPSGTVISAEKEPNNSSAIAQVVSTKWSCPTFGFEHDIPGGFIPTDRTSAKNVGRFVRYGDKGKNFNTIIIVDAGRPTDADLQQTAAGLAKDWNGNIGEATTLDGEKAVLVKATNNSATLKPVYGLVSHHNGVVFLVMGGVFPGHECVSDIELIRKSWHWTAVESPARNLDFGITDRRLFEDKVLMNFPRLMYKIPTDKRSDEHFGLYNLARRQDEFLMYGRVLEMPDAEKPDSTTFADSAVWAAVKERGITDSLKKKFRWHLIKGETKLITDSVEIDDEIRAAIGQSTLIKGTVTYAAVMLAKNQLLFLSFSVFSESTEDRATYERTIERIVKTIHTE